MPSHGTRRYKNHRQVIFFSAGNIHPLFLFEHHVLFVLSIPLCKNEINCSGTPPSVYRFCPHSGSSLWTFQPPEVPSLLPESVFLCRSRGSYGRPSIGTASLWRAEFF